MGKLVSISISRDLFPSWWNGNTYEKLNRISFLSEEDTYIAGVGLSTQENILRTLRNEVNILYESPLTLNLYHSERTKPSQRIIIFEKKCTTTRLVPDVLPTEKTPEVTT